MALARNLKSNRIPKIRPSKNSNRNYKKITIYALAGFAVAFGVYGILNLSRLAPTEEDRGQVVVLETGDAPLPEELKIWIDADGGLNMRSEPSTESEIIKIIPDDTELVAIELSGDWYKVKYDDKTGWVHKDYIKVFNEKENVEIAGDWKTYRSSSFKYSVEYPKDWVYSDYGANKAANLLGYVGFGVHLSDELDPVKLPPIVVKVTSDAEKVVNGEYNKKTESSSSDITVSGVKGKKYVYTASSGVQMTAVVVSKGGNTYIIEESGGYADELSTMVNKLKLS